MLTHEPRPATPADVPALRRLIDASVRGLNAGLYTDAQVESALRYVFGPDTALIADGTYFVIEVRGVLAAAGGWGRRRTLYGGDQMKSADPEPLLDPATEPARIRAFYVHPEFARRGLARALFEACRTAARDAGFRRLALASTLPGLALYRALGFAETGRDEALLPDGVRFPVVHMERSID